MKERHFASSFGRSQFGQKESMSKGYGVNQMKTSDSIDNMYVDKKTHGNKLGISLSNLKQMLLVK